MKYLLLFLLSLPALSQTRNCQMECPNLDQNTNEDATYRLYRERQACLSSCEQVNRQEQRIQAQEEDIARQKEEIDQQKDQLETQQNTLKELQEKVNDLEANQ